MNNPILALAKVSGSNSFRDNQNYSDSFRYLYPSQCESFRTNPKNVLYLVWWIMVKNRSDLIRFNPRQQSEWVRTNPKSSFQSESIRMNPRSEWFGLILIGNSVWFNPSSDWFGLKTWLRIHSDSCLGLNGIRSDRFFTVFHQTIYKIFFELVRDDSHWLRYRYQNESV